MRHAALILKLRVDGMTQRQIAAYVGCSPSHVHKTVTRVDRVQIYYILFAGRIKIGTTNNLPQRLYDIPCDELLAVEPGGPGVELARHAQFAERRIIGEWFQDCPELRAHIDTLRAVHQMPTGLPQQRRYAAWVTA